MKANEAWEQQDLVKAEEYYLEALKEAKESENLYPGVGVTALNLGRFYVQQEKFPEAEMNFINSIKAMEDHLRIPKIMVIPLFPYGATAAPIPHPDTEYMDLARANVALGDLYLHQSKYDEAEPFLTDALNLIKEYQGSEHPTVPLVMILIAEVKLSQYKAEEAELLVQQSLTLSEKSPGPDNIMLVKQLRLLGVIYFSQQKYSEAEQVYRRIISLVEKSNTNHFTLKDYYAALGNVVLQQGEIEEAEEFFKKSKELEDQDSLDKEFQENSLHE